MGITASDAKILSGMFLRHGIEGNCLTMGRQDIMFSHPEFELVQQQLLTHMDCSEDYSSGAYERPQNHIEDDEDYLSDTEFFTRLGLTSVESVDASTFEGSTYAFDLNHEGLADQLGKQYDVIIDSGTAEHIFHLPNFLKNIVDCLKVGGVAIHFLPVNNFVDHGFYQFSPTLFYDFYRANDFSTLEMMLIFSCDEFGNNLTWRKYNPGEFDRVSKDEIEDKYFTIAAFFRKKETSTSNAIPQQRIYSDDVNWQLGLSGTCIDGKPDFEVLTGPFARCSGHCWRVRLKNVSIMGDSPAATKASTLVLLEDGMVLGSAHALHDDIRQLGLGRYSHWEGYLFFSTSDNSDPNNNGRVYVLKNLVD